MLLLGCRPKGRYTEQHDVFFSVGKTIADLVPEIVAFWPEVKGIIHVDAWRQVTQIDGYNIAVADKSEEPAKDELCDLRLYFINLGGYRKNEFEEYHYKTVVVAPTKAMAIKQAKETVFYKHTGFKGAPSHIDDKYGIDVDDLWDIKEILSPAVKSKYNISITPASSIKEDELHLGYFKLDKL